MSNTESYTDEEDRVHYHVYWPDALLGRTESLADRVLGTDDVATLFSDHFAPHALVFGARDERMFANCVRHMRAVFQRDALDRTKTYIALAAQDDALFVSVARQYDVSLDVLSAAIVLFERYYLRALARLANERPKH